MSDSFYKTTRTVRDSISAVLGQVLDTVGHNHQKSQNTNSSQHCSPHQPASASPASHHKQLASHLKLNFSLPTLRATTAEASKINTSSISDPIPNHATSSSCAFLPTPSSERSPAYSRYPPIPPPPPPQAPHRSLSTKSTNTPGFRNLVLSEKLTASRQEDSHRYPAVERPQKNIPRKKVTRVIENTDGYRKPPFETRAYSYDTPSKYDSLYSVEINEKNGASYEGNEKNDSNNNGHYQPPLTQVTHHKPYIGLGARLSQIWINQYTIFLILIIIKITSFVSTLHMLLNTAENSTNSNCNSAETVASHALAAPHDLAYGATVILEKGVQYGILALMTLFYILFQVLQEVAFFALSTLVGTYACLITAAVDEVANVGLNIAEDVIGFANKTVNTVVGTLETSLNAVEQAVGSVADIVNQINGVFTKQKNKDVYTIQHIDVNLSGLKNLSIPSTVLSSIEELRTKIPNYETVTNKTKEVIGLPFGLLFKEINNTIASKQIAYNRSAVSLPPQPTVLFCSTNGSTGKTPTQVFFDLLHKIIHDICKVFVIILVTAAILACVPMAWREIRKWIWVQDCAERAAAYEMSVEQINYERGSNTNEKQHLSNNRVSTFFGVDPPSTRISKYMEVIFRAGHHYTSKFQDFIVKRVGNPRGNGSGIGPGNTPGNIHKKVMAQWWSEYVTYHPALGVLFLGFCGLFVVILQFIIVSKVKHAYMDVISDSKSGHSSSFFTTNNMLTFGKQETDNALLEVEQGIDKWVLTANNEMHRVQDQINEQLLGWVHEATGSMNDSLTVFYDAMNKEIANTFNGTIFYDGISSVVYCTVGSKIEAIQKGIRWIHNNTQINMPNVTADMIVNATKSGTQNLKGSASSNQNSSLDFGNDASSSKLEVLLEKAKSVLQSGIIFALNYIESNIFQELYISLALIGAWVFVALTGYLYCRFVVWRETEKAKAAALGSYNGTSPGGPHAPKNRGIVGYSLRFFGAAAFMGKAVSGLVFRPIELVAAKTSNLLKRKSSIDTFFQTGSDSSPISKGRKKGLNPVVNYSSSKYNQNNGKSITIPQQAATRESNRVSTIRGIGSFEYLNYQSDGRSASKAKSTLSLPFSLSRSQSPGKFNSIFAEKISSPPRPLNNPNVNQHSIPLNIVTRRPGNAVAPSWSSNAVVGRRHIASIIGPSAENPDTMTEVLDFRSFPFTENLKTTFEEESSIYGEDEKDLSTSPTESVIDQRLRYDDNYRSSALGSPVYETNETEESHVGRQFPPPPPYTPEKQKKRKREGADLGLEVEHSNTQAQAHTVYQNGSEMIRDWSTGSHRQKDGITSFYDSVPSTPVHPELTQNKNYANNLNKRPVAPQPVHLTQTGLIRPPDLYRKRMTLDSPILGNSNQSLFKLGSNNSSYTDISQVPSVPPIPVNFGIQQFTPPGYFGEAPSPTTPTQATPRSFQATRHRQNKSGQLYGKLRLKNQGYANPFSRSHLSPVTSRAKKSPKISTFHRSPANPFDSFYALNGQDDESYEEEPLSPTMGGKAFQKDRNSQNSGSKYDSSEEEEDLIVIPGPSTSGANEVTPKSVRNKRPSLKISPKQYRKSQHVTLCYTPH